MSRHLWKGRRPGPRKVAPTVAVPDKADLPGPRPARSVTEPPPSPEEITVEIPRIGTLEPAEPALSLIALGRHGMR